LPSNSHFSVSDIETKLKTLSNTTSAGPDGISGSFLVNIKSLMSNMAFGLIDPPLSTVSYLTTTLYRLLKTMLK